MARFGVALDIDGVLIRGSHLLPNTRRALEILFNARIPTVFITNGGGLTEKQKADDLTKKIGLPISSQHLILSHTPFKQYIPRYEESPVLIIGGHECLKVANSYGFKNAFTSAMLHSSVPDIYPLKFPQLSQSHYDSHHIPNEYPLNTIEAAFVFAESCDWGLDIQILTDLLHFNSNNFPIFACNADLIYNSNFISPRYTQGAFLHSFQSLYDRYCQQKVHIEYCGKPYLIQYQYAENILHQIHTTGTMNISIGHHPSEPEQRSREEGKGEWHSQDVCRQSGHMSSLIRYYGIGDNPASDIRGANCAGKDWRSILVKTGIYRDGDRFQSQEEIPHYIEEDILDAVNRIFHCEGYSPPLISRS
jgi:HAD superfamily hydrolase (TIGR01456 family)